MTTEIETAANREELLATAFEIEPEFAYDIDGPGKFDGCSDRLLAAALDALCGVSAQDDSAGSVDYGLHVARFGRFVLTTSSDGFVDVETFDNDDEAYAFVEEYSAQEGNDE